MVSSIKIFPNCYRDSVELLRLAADVQKQVSGVKQATAMMATPANHEMLLKGRTAAEAAQIKAAEPNDTVIVVEADSTKAIEAAVAHIAKALSGEGGPVAKASGAVEAPKTIFDAVRTAKQEQQVPQPNFLICSAPGTYAAAEAMKALKAGLHVFLFSDNVSVEEEVELKQLAVEKKLFVMGPDCGTALIDGVPFAFANACRTGRIGLVGASGTGLQEVSTLIDRLGEGVSQMIGLTGTGGRDLSEKVGGRMLLAGMERLAEDAGTSVLVLVSKPPAPSVAKLVYDRVKAIKKPIVIVFLGADGKAILDSGAVAATTLEDAATLAVALAKGVQPDTLRKQYFSLPSKLPGTVAKGQRIEGLFSGGTFCKESALILDTLAKENPALKGHKLTDLGEDQFCLGKPHPMIDASTRVEWIQRAGKDSSVGVILLDVVIGYGSNADPAGALGPAIKSAIAGAKAEGRTLHVVASVHGTDQDFQGFAGQEQKLKEAGALLTRSNASATRLAASIVAGKLLEDKSTYTAPKTVPRPPAAKPTRMFPDGMCALNLGLASFVEAPRKAGATAIQLDWKPPALGDRDVGFTLARMEDDESSPVGRAIAAGNKEALARVLGSGAVVTDIRPAAEVTGMALMTLGHAGPPIEWKRMCGPMRGAVAGAAMFEGWAKSVEEAEKLADEGKIKFTPCHHLNAVGPMAGLLSPSMPVFVVKNHKYNITAFASMNEGLGKVLRFGANSPEVLTRLRFMKDIIAPALANVFKSHPLDAKALMSQALTMGDEVHNRNMAATSLFVRTIASPLLKSNTPDVARQVFEFLDQNSHFFLNISMPACKAMLQAAHGVKNSSVVTVMSRNGVDFGIRLAGTGDQWFTAPAPPVKALFFPGYAPDDANLDMGDSSITETLGVGGFAMAAAPAIIKFVGGSSADAVRQTREMFKITLGRNPEFSLAPLDFIGTPTAIDARRVADSGIAPVINTGIAHKKPGVGQIGAGIANAPLLVFNKALQELSRRVARGYSTQARPARLPSRSPVNYQVTRRSASCAARAKPVMI